MGQHFPELAGGWGKEVGRLSRGAEEEEAWGGGLEQRDTSKVRTVLQNEKQFVGSVEFRFSPQREFEDVDCGVKGGQDEALR